MVADEGLVRNWRLRRKYQNQDGMLRLSLTRRTQHVAIQAPPGKGKTTGYVISQLIEDAVSGLSNAYVIDRKSPELYLMLCDVWEQHGHRVIKFDPWTPGLTWSVHSQTVL